MKVVRPEWLVESANAGRLLPWKDFIFNPTERPEETQGAKINQKTLFNRIDRPWPPANPEPVLEASTNQTRVAPDPNQAPKSPPTAVQSPADPQTAPGYAAHTSNPHAQRAMANPDWRNAHTSAAPDFIEGYYKNSRLHHLSAWKAELKNLVQEAQERAENISDGGKVPAVPAGVGEDGVSMKGAELVMRSPKKDKGKAKALDEDGDHERVIMHCDFDCFFVSAGLVSRPRLRGKPVVVCHSQGAQGGSSSTSEIASASYEAREFGIKNGMRWAVLICWLVTIIDAPPLQVFNKPGSCVRQF